MYKIDIIWMGDGVEIYKGGKRSNQSISFKRSDIDRAIRAIQFLANKGSGSGDNIGGTTLRRTSTTIRMEDYQGRKLSIRPKEIPKIIMLLSSKI